MASNLYSDSVELVTYEDDVDAAEDLSELDEPLPLHSSMNSTHKLPKWMSQQRSLWMIRPKAEVLIAWIKPKLTWRYMIFASLILYIFYCIVRGSPLLASKLPKYTGEHEVGVIDLEIPLESPRLLYNNTVLKDSGIHPFELETVLFSIYYPSARGSKSRKRHPWIPRPISLTAEGYARIAGINNFLTRPVFTFALWIIAGGIDIPAHVNVPLLGYHDTKPSEETFPVTVFSHGFASSRTDYTYYAGELASRGHVVALIEHRDGSGPGSFVIKNGVRVKRVTSFGLKDLSSDPPLDIANLKVQQLGFRTAEIEETIAILKRINSGQGKEVFECSSIAEGHTLHQWKGRLNFSLLTIAGHSYGATGALQALKGEPSKKIGAIGGIILDPGKSSGPLNSDLDVPVLVVHSNSWSAKHSIFFGRPHFDTVRDLVLKAVERVKASWFVTSIGTSHPSVTDAPLIEPWLLSFSTGATINVNEGLREYVKISMDFFAYLANKERQGILSEKVTHLEYGKWVSKEREAEFPKDVAKYWEIHVAPE